MPKWFSEIFKRKEAKPELLLDLSDARLSISPFGADWLCPYTLKRIPTPDWNGDPQTLLNSPTVANHLNNLVESATVAPQMNSWVTVVETAISMRLQDSPNYKLTSARGEWICPYCAANTGIPLLQWDGSPSPMEWFMPEAMGHLRSCPPYIKNPLGAKSIREVNASRGLKEIRSQLLRRVADEPLFSVCDDTGAWICPYSLRAVDKINLVDSEWGYEVQNQIVDYLVSPQCPGSACNWLTHLTVADLQRAAAKISKERAVIASKTAAEQEMSKMREQVEQTNASVHEIKKDLERARKAQLKMLPDKPPAIPGYEIASYYEACAELGGDLYHFLDVGKGYTGFLIGDVSGHGVEAAVIMSSALKSFEVRSTGILSPMAVMKEVNSSLLKDVHRGKFVSSFYAVLEQATGKMRCARGGHPPALLVDGNGDFHLLEGKGLALGIGNTEAFAKSIEEYEVELTPGSTFLLYTDGFPEAMNANNDEFTEEKLYEVFAQHAALPAKQVIQAILAKVREHVGNIPMADDLTLVVVKRL